VARFIVSHRLAGKSAAALQTSQDAHNTVRAAIRAVASVVSDRPQTGRTRGLMVVDADPRDMLAQQASAPPDVIIELEVLRRPARFTMAGLVAVQTTDAGTGAMFKMTVRTATGPQTNATVQLIFSNLQSGTNASVEARTDAQGRASVPYDSGQWWPVNAIITPHSGQWSWLAGSPTNGSVVTLTDLPGGTHIGWWHQLLGIASYQAARGQGIRVGVADTGVGPHPYLAHAQLAGAFLNGSHNADPASAHDVGVHGTHVSGLIGARPPAAGAGYCGIAPGADLAMARVFPDATSTASNGDIAAAIDTLSADRACDLINLSLGGTDSSAIEQDAVTAAIETGTLILAAAGNGAAAIEYPAAYSGVVAVSALGLYGSFPSSAIEALTVPTSGGFVGNLFDPSFNNTGPHMACIGPGVGIISTVPGVGPADAAYAAMSGTSMACPVVCGALATLLSADTGYGKLPRDVKRAQYAWNVLVRSLHQLGLGSTVEGYGLVAASAT
jgi:subtilisin family serine protease